MMYQRYCELLQDSVNLLANPTQTLTLAHWRGTASLPEFVEKYPTRQAQKQSNNPLPKCIVALEVAKWALSVSAPELIDTDISGTADRISPIDLVISTLEDGINKHQPTNPLFAAISQAVVAGLLFRKRDYAKSYAALAIAGCLYDQAWPLNNSWVCQTPVTRADPRTLGPDLANKDQALEVLRLASECGSFGTQGIRTSTFLILHRLLGHLFDLPVASVKFGTQVKALFVDGADHGMALMIKLEKKFTPLAGYAGAFVDPIRFGVTQLEKSMSNSLRVGWRCARQSIKSLNTRQYIIEIGLKVPDSCGILHGGSAGALLAAGMIAAAKERPIDDNRTATCCLKLSDQMLAQADETPVHEQDLEFTEIRGLIPKIRETWYGQSGIDELLLCEEDKRKWDEEFPEADGMTRTNSVASVYELVERLTSNSRFDTILTRHANNVYPAWNHSVAQAAIEFSDDIDKDHRFDCYIPPMLLVEGPLEKPSIKNGSDTSAGAHQAETINREVHPVGGQVPELPPVSELTRQRQIDDRQLLQLMELMIRGRRWESAPKWLQPSRPIVLYDNAGAGKTVCSHRLRHLLTTKENWRLLFGDGAVPLVVRLEGGWPKDKNDKPYSLQRVLVDRLRVEGQLRDQKLEKLKSTVEYALSRKRVVLILDGFDQFFPEDREHVINIFKRQRTLNQQQFHLVITSRVHTIDQYRSKGQFFTDEGWTRVRIEPFSEQQQDAYFDCIDASKNQIGSRWLEMVANREAMKELLGLPMVLAMLRLMHDQAVRENKPLPVFGTLSELYIVTTRKLLSRALEFNRKAVDTELKRSNTAVPSLSAEEELEALEHVLTLIAFQLMLMEEYDGKIEDKGKVERLLYLSQQRYLREVAVEKQPAAIVRWNWALKVLQTIELNHRSVVERHRDDGIVFRSRKMLECHAARYLTRYATDWDVFAEHDMADMPIVDRRNRAQNLETLCAWNYTTHPDWSETWNLAINMPKLPVNDDQDGVIAFAVIDHQVTCRSLSALFELPKLYEARDIRPTELIFYAWHLFEYDERLLRESSLRIRDFPNQGEAGEATSSVNLQFIQGEKIVESFGLEELKRQGQLRLLGGDIDPDAEKMREEVLARFRASSKSILQEMDRRRDKIGLNGEFHSLPVDDAERKSFLQRWQQESSLDKSCTLLQCPPRSWIEAHRSGRLSNDPCVNSAIKNYETEPMSPILVQTTTVTRRMYRQFDPRFETTGKKDGLGTPIQSEIQEKASAFGQHTINYEFPIICTNWFDAWVFAKWLGSEFRLPTEFEWEFACRARTCTMFHFGNGLNGTQANCDGRYPIGSDVDGNELEKGTYLGKTTPVGLSQYPVNDFGLFDMHGNVWEWCSNWYSGPGSGRVVRGGSWSSNALSCAGSYRGDDRPGVRDYFVGFRVCRA